MEVKQISQIMNEVTAEILGKTDMIKEDLSGIVDIGKEVLNSTNPALLDNYVRSLVNHVGKVVFVNRAYAGNQPKILRDGWEWGSILEKIRMDIPKSVASQEWMLVDGQSYDPNVFYAPKISAKFFNDRTTYTIPISTLETQVRESFSSPAQLNGLMSMIYTMCNTGKTINNDALTLRLINNGIGETLVSEYGSDSFDSKSTVKAVNLLYLYNDTFDTELTAENCLYEPEFIRFATWTMGNYIKWLKGVTTLLNIGKTTKFTPAEKLHVVLLSTFKSAAEVYLQSGTFWKDLVSLPNSEEVSYWQASGLGFDFSDVSKIDITTASGTDVTLSGILGVMFDHDAIGICNYDESARSNYNEVGHFYTTRFSYTAGHFNDLDENFVVFFVA